MLLRHHGGLAHAGHHGYYLLDLGAATFSAADLQHILGAVAEFIKRVEQRDAVAGEEIGRARRSSRGWAFSLCRYSENSDRPECLDQEIAGVAVGVGAPSSR